MSATAARDTDRDIAQAETIASLGRITCTLTLRQTTPGGPPALSTLHIKTSRPRGAYVGGGMHTYALHAHAGGSDEAHLHALLREIADLLPEQCVTTTQARNAFQERDRERRRRERAEARLRNVMTGGAPGRCIGRTLVRVTDDGAAWLLDPEKQERGFGYRYGSLADLWRDQPHLRPTEWGVNEQGRYLLVEPFALEV